MKKWKILVTPKEACDALRTMPKELLESVVLFPVDGRVNDRQRLTNLLMDKDGVVLDIEPITAAILEKCPSLKVISRFGEGCDVIDFEAARERDVLVTKTRGVSSQAVARHALSLILALTHNVVENDRNLKNGVWNRLPNLSDDDLTAGIVGFGKIGKELALLLSACGFVVLTYSRGAYDSRFSRAASIEELVEGSDIISLHLPLTPETNRLISGNLLSLLKGKYLVNTARGMLVDEDALLESLDRNELKGYATDVFVREPLTDVSERLVRHPRVVCSPHIAALDEATAVRMTKRAIENAIHSLEMDHGKVDSFAD